MANLARYQYWVFGGVGAVGQATARSAQEVGSVVLTVAAVPKNIGIELPTVVPSTGNAVTHIVLSESQYDVEFAR